MDILVLDCIAVLTIHSYVRHAAATDADIENAPKWANEIKGKLSQGMLIMPYEIGDFAKRIDMFLSIYKKPEVDEAVVSAMKQESLLASRGCRIKPHKNKFEHLRHAHLHTKKLLWK